ncbi:hypothetical protein DERF_001507 [Dermatophagoides farinae]|uniref:Uncharacterized protein n=1 Tax=Dermatophagoides farinae TaxID=6954 RepID=A0A922I8R9_DERFA|nr:hypothetical protein DERF_001507 [Dermatophagoides farinae]
MNENNNNDDEGHIILINLFFPCPELELGKKSIEFSNLLMIREIFKFSSSSSSSSSSMKGLMETRKKFCYLNNFMAKDLILLSIFTAIVLLQLIYVNIEQNLVSGSNFFIANCKQQFERVELNQVNSEMEINTLVEKKIVLLIRFTSNHRSILRRMILIFVIDLVWFD